MDYMESKNEVLPLVELERRHSSQGKLSVKKENLSRLTEDVEDIPLSVISINGPPSLGKLLVLSYMIRYLQASEDDEYDWMDWENPDKPLEELKWPEGKSQDTPGIWGYERPFIIKTGEGSKRKETAVLLLYSQTTNRNGMWDTAKDVSALMGLSLSLSSLTVFNVHKHPDEQCLAAVADYVKYAVHAKGFPGIPTKKTKTSTISPPLQKTNFLVRDWNFPSDYAYGMSGGKNFVKGEKLKGKRNHNKESYQNRLLINHLFEDVSGCLLPFPGMGIQNVDEFTGSISQVGEKFAKCVEDFVSSIINIDQLTVKKDNNGRVVTGKVWEEMVQNHVNSLNKVEGESCQDSEKILRRYRVKVVPTEVEQKGHVQTAVRAYTDYWKRYEKGNKFFDEKALTDINRKAKRKALEVFEDAMNAQEDDDDDDDDNIDKDDSDEDGGDLEEKGANMKQLLNDKIVKRFKEIREENGKRRGGYIKQIKNEFLQQYRDTMAAAFPVGGRKGPPSENAVKKESKEAKANISAEYLEKIGANGDRDNMNEEQEAEMDKFMDCLASEEKQFIERLYEQKKKVDHVDKVDVDEENTTDSEDSDGLDDFR